MKTKTVFPAMLLIFLSIFAGCKKEQKSDMKPETAIATPIANSTGSLPHTKKYSADVATAWFNLLANTSRSKPYIPAQSTRIFSYASLALYEAVVPGMPSYQSIFRHFTGNRIDVDHKKDYYWPACANAALARITTKLFQNYPAPNLVPVQTLENTMNISFQAEVSAEQLQYSNEFGRYVADLIYDWSKTDGTLALNGVSLAICPPYVPLGIPGTWIPTPPGFLPAAGACQGSIRTFVSNVVNTTLPAPPPAYSTDPSSGFYQMVNEVYQLRNAVSTSDSMIVEVWRDRVGFNYNIPAHLLKLSSEIVAKEKLNLEDATVFFAKLNMSISDAIGAAFFAKFHPSLNLIRPITYIRNVMGQPTWNSIYNTPQHPSYPAVAPGAAAAGVQILENTFGINYSFIDSTQKSLYGSYNYNSFNGLLQDVGKSRTHGGINFKNAVEAGYTQGRSIGTKVDQLPFKKP